jgi:ubiquinone/menaquinone biosynthesis C-methylase UbiE/predicted transcriptional regulator
MNPFEKKHDLTWSFAGAVVFSKAAKVGLLSALAKQKDPISAKSLSSKLKLDKEAVRKILNALTALDILLKRSEKYSLKSDFKRLFNRHEEIIDWIMHADYLAIKWYEQMEGYLKTGKIKRRIRNFEDQRSFLGAMKFNSYMIFDILIKNINLNNVKKMVDIGGGSGTYSINIVKRYKKLNSYVLDIPQSKEIALKDIKHEKLDKRIHFIGMDYFDMEFENRFDFALIANVLHQEKESDCKRLLKKTYNALKTGGRVCILDFAIDETKTKPLFGALFAINMFDFGDCYSFSQLKKWLKWSGFKNIKRRFLDSKRWIIIGYK